MASIGHMWYLTYKSLYIKKINVFLILMSKIKSINSVFKNKDAIENYICDVRENLEFALKVMKDEKLRSLSNKYGTTLAHEAVKFHHECGIYALTDYAIAKLSDNKGNTVAHFALKWKAVRENFQDICSDKKIKSLKNSLGFSVIEQLDFLKTLDKNMPTIRAYNN